MSQLRVITSHLEEEVKRELRQRGIVILLSRLLPFIFSPPAFFLIQNSRLSYQEIWVMTQRTTQYLYLLCLVLICGFLALALRTVDI